MASELLTSGLDKALLSDDTERLRITPEGIQWVQRCLDVIEERSKLMPLRPEGSLSSSALEDLLDEDARLPYVKCLPVSHCVRHGREGVRSMSLGAASRVLCGTTWAPSPDLGGGASWAKHLLTISAVPRELRSVPRTLAYAHWDVCLGLSCEAEPAFRVHLNPRTAHLTLLLSAPRSYRLDGLFTPNKVPMIWEQLGVGLGYILWNPTGFKLLDVLYSGWPIFALLRELRWKLIRLKGSEADEYRDLHRLRRSMMFDGPLDAAMARIICIYQPKRIEETSCPVLEAENALEKAEELDWTVVCISDVDAEMHQTTAWCNSKFQPFMPKEMVFQKTTSIWQSHEKHSAFEKLLTKAETELRRLLPWFQAPAEEFQSPAARLAVGLLIAGDVALPRLERLQRQLRRFTSKAQPLGDYPSCGSELPEQGALVAEARYVQGLFNQPVLTGGQPRAQPKEAWVTFLWGGSGTAERRAWIYGEAIRTLAHSVPPTRPCTRLMGKDWTHDGATPLSDVDTNASYTGTVTNVGQFGVFVDFGAVKDGLLKVPSKLGRRLRKGMQIEDLTILSIDPDAGKDPRL
eukprot:g21534.t1